MPGGVALTFADVGLGRVRSRAVSIAGRARDAAPAWELIAQSFTRAEGRLFATEGAYGGRPWAPLSPAYAEWKSVHYPGKGILERTGALKQSLTEGPAVRVITPGGAVLGTDVRYAEYHQDGTTKMPARPVLITTEPGGPGNPQLRGAWQRTLRRWVLGGELVIEDVLL